MPVTYGSFEISDDQPLLQQLATDVMAETAAAAAVARLRRIPTALRAATAGPLRAALAGAA